MSEKPTIFSLPESKRPSEKDSNLEVAGNRKKIKKSTFLIFFDRFLDCDFLHNFARKRKFTPILV